MADNIIKDAEFTGIKKNDGEDPLIVAQRFLNIFKQLHIFNSEKKNNFNQMLLELKPEIRGMFSSLPGGSLLQEYVNELETKAGMVRSSAAETTISSSKENILQTALKEVSQQAQENGTVSNVPQTTPRPAADASFAKEMAQAFKEAGIGGNADLQLLRQALQINEEGRRRETAEITKAINESQLKMAQMLVQNNTSNSGNSANNIQIHNVGGNFPPVEEMVSGIVKAQSKLFSDMAKIQTQELSSIISLALRESHQLSTKSIIDTLTAFQRENLRILGLKNYPSEESKIFDLQSESNKEEVLSKKDKKKKKKNKNKKEEPDTPESEWGFTPVSDSKYSLDQSLFGFDHDAKNQKNKKDFDELNDRLDKEFLLDSDELEDYEEAEEENPEDEEFADTDDEMLDETEQEFDYEENQEEEKIEEDEKKEEVLKKNKLFNKPKFENLPFFKKTTSIEDAKEPIDLDKNEELTDEKTSDWGFGKEDKKETKKKTENVEEEWEWQKVEDEEHEEETIEKEPETNDLEIDDFVFYDNQDNMKPADSDIKDETSGFKVIDKEGVVTEDYGTKTETNFDEEWEYEEVPEDEETSAESEDEWEWDYEEVPEQKETSAKPSENDNNEELNKEEWEWDYEETPEDEETSTESEEEWEWDYEEVPEQEETPAKPAENDNNEALNEEEWEWDYEEVPENENDEKKIS